MRTIPTFRRARSRPQVPTPGRPDDAAATNGTARDGLDAAPTQAKRPRFPESPCGKMEVHERHAYTFTTGYHSTGYYCPGVEPPPEVPQQEYVTPEQMKQVHDAWWDFWISESDHQRSVHQMLGVVILAQSVLLVWLTLRVLGG